MFTHYKTINAFVPSTFNGLHSWIRLLGSNLQSEKKHIEVTYFEMVF